MGTLNASDIARELPAEQVERMRADGFTAVPRFLDDATLEILRDYYDRIIRKEIFCGGDDRQLGGVTRQVMHPRNHIPYFADNPAVQLGKAYARQILGREVVLCFDMLIYKPPGHPKSTPWHQDFAYRTMPFAAAGSMMDGGGLQFWVALDDVDFANGCMHFLPGLHTRGMREHFVYAGSPEDEGRLLATKAFGDPDLPNAGVACPLKAGGCTIHTYGTPHYTPPNVTKDRGRRAYIFNLRAE